MDVRHTGAIESRATGSANEASRYRKRVDPSSPLLALLLLAYGTGLITTLLMLFTAGYLNCRLISFYRRCLPLVQSSRRERTGETYITFCRICARFSPCPPSASVNARHKSVARARANLPRGAEHHRRPADRYFQSREVPHGPPAIYFITRISLMWDFSQVGKDKSAW